MTGQGRRRPALSVDEAELRCSAIAKVARRPRNTLKRQLINLPGGPREIFQRHQPIDSLGHALQRAAAENA